MAFLDVKTTEQLKKHFEHLDKKITILMYTQPDMGKCQFCRDTETVYGEVAALSDKIAFMPIVLTAANEDIKKYDMLELAPSAVILDSDMNDTGIRFYGVPAGYEFTTLIETILMVSTGTLSLKKETIEFAKSISKPVDLKVFIGLTCPYCPAAVFLAHQLAFASGGKIKSSMIESGEYPFLANRYNVMGVPRTIINDKGSVEGAAPEDMLLNKIKEVLR